jgi:hypothetical protein
MAPTKIGSTSSGLATASNAQCAVPANRHGRMWQKVACHQVSRSGDRITAFGQTGHSLGRPDRYAATSGTSSTASGFEDIANVRSEPRLSSLGEKRLGERLRRVR